jgi:hypothetical protein
MTSLLVSLSRIQMREASTYAPAVSVRTFLGFETPSCTVRFITSNPEVIRLIRDEVRGLLFFVV